jgi:hypothetical protein
MSFIRIRTRKNRRYLYRETRWREGRRIRSRSEYLGPLGDLSGASRAFDEAQDRAMAVAEREAAKIDAYQRGNFGETAFERSQRQQREQLDRLHAHYGLKLGPSNPVPAEPAPAAAPSQPGKDEVSLSQDSRDAETQDDPAEGEEASNAP